MNEADFRKTIQNIVADCIPDEVVAFELAGKDHIERAFRSFPAIGARNPGDRRKSTGPGKRELTEFEFLAEAKEVIEFAGLVKGTLELYQWFKKQFKEAKTSHDNKTNLAARWQDELRRAGLSDKKAELIALRFSADVLELFRKANEHS